MEVKDKEKLNNPLKGWKWFFTQCNERPWNKLHVEGTYPYIHISKYRHPDSMKESAKGLLLWKSRTRETLNLSTDAYSSTNIFVSAGVKKRADSIILFFCPPVGRFREKEFVKWLSCITLKARCSNFFLYLVSFYIRQDAPNFYLQTIHSGYVLILKIFVWCKMSRLKQIS